MTKQEQEIIIQHVKTAVFEAHPISKRWIVLPCVIILLVLAAMTVNEKHLWQLDWRAGYDAWYNCRAVPDSHGHSLEAWRWVEGREIRFYAPYGMPRHRVDAMVNGVENLIAELHLDVHVRVLPLPTRVALAMARATHPGQPNSLDFNTLCRELVSTRDGRYAEMLITPCDLESSSDTLGMADFRYGVAVLEASTANSMLARHETGHLLGYHLHDNWPYHIFGYTEHPIKRQHGQEVTYLMMPEPQGDQLSPRSQDALHYFWAGLGTRTEQHYFHPAGGMVVAQQVQQ